MNVYDFDKTLYRGDSTLDFWKYEIKQKPDLLKFLPHQCLYAIKYMLGRATKEKFKEEFYIFFSEIDNIDFEVKKFWKTKKNNFCTWYNNVKKSDDVVISASPEFIVVEGCKKLGISYVIASQVDKNSGKYIGKNCKGKEKVYRYHTVFGNKKIDNFYSDSLSDKPLAELSDNAFLIKNGRIHAWRKDS